MNAGLFILIAGLLFMAWAGWILFSGRAPTGRGQVAHRSDAGIGSAIFYWIVLTSISLVGSLNAVFGVYMLVAMN